MNGHALYYRSICGISPTGMSSRRNGREVPIFSDYKEIGYYNVPDSMSNIDPAAVIWARTGPDTPAHPAFVYVD